MAASFFRCLRPRGSPRWRAGGVDVLSRALASGRITSYAVDASLGTPSRRGASTPSPTQDYVYGILAKSGVGDRAHNLAHMMASGLCDKAEVNLDLGFGVDGGGIGA